MVFQCVCVNERDDFLWPLGVNIHSQTARHPDAVPSGKSLLVTL